MLFDSKLPDVGTTIFTVMSRRALEDGAVNLGPGASLTTRSIHAYRRRSSRRSPRGAINTRPWKAWSICGPRSRTSLQCEATPADSIRNPEITVTCGGTEALYDSIQAVVRAGDEVIIFDPSYDAYEPAVRLAGGRCVRVPAGSAHVPLRLGSRPQRRGDDPDTPHHHQQSAESRAARWPAPDDLDALAAFCFATAPSAFSPTKCTSTCCSTAGVTRRSSPHLELRARSFAVFSFDEDACTPPAGGWVTASHRRR